MSLREELTVRAAGWLALIAGLSGGGVIAAACASSPAPADVAMRTYEGEQAACVAAYATRAEIDACRATVRALWGLPARDAGVEAGR